MRRLTGVIQPYAWGSTTVIPDLLGNEPTGEPQAELWLGAHPLAPALLDGEPLDQVVDSDPEAVLGSASVAAFGPRLPYLVKVIAAEQPLSLQAHPSREQAEAGYAREQAAGVPRDAPYRTYRDGWPKPEVLCALIETEALCGFRDPDATYRLFGALGVDSALALVAPLAAGGTPAAVRLESVFARMLRLGEAERVVVDQVVQAAAGVTPDGELGLFARTARELGEHYPGDPGILAALLMNRVTLQPDEALFLPAGNLHAYLRGAGVEIMASSDNVVRGGLTPKHVDVDELLSVLDFSPTEPVTLGCTEEHPGVWRYRASAPEFALWRLAVAGRPVPVPSSGSGRVLLVTDGTVTATAGAVELDLVRGQSAFVSAGEDARLTGDGTVFVGAPGV